MDNELWIKLNTKDTKAVYDILKNFTVSEEMFSKIISLNERDIEVIKETMKLYFTSLELQNFTYPIYKDFIEKKEAFIENFTKEKP